MRRPDCLVRTLALRHIAETSQPKPVVVCPIALTDHSSATFSRLGIDMIGVGFGVVFALGAQLQPGQHGGTGVSRAVASHARPVPPPTDTGAVAVRAASAPTIDGKDDDVVWRDAPPISSFLQWQPTEGKAPRFKTEAKVAYDAANLFVFVRAFDPHPDSII